MLKNCKLCHYSDKNGICLYDDNPDNCVYYRKRINKTKEYKPLKPQKHKCPKCEKVTDEIYSVGEINQKAPCINCLKVKIGYRNENNVNRII